MPFLVAIGTAGKRDHCLSYRLYCVWRGWGFRRQAGMHRNTLLGLNLIAYTSIIPTPATCPNLPLLLLPGLFLLSFLVSLLNALWPSSMLPDKTPNLCNTPAPTPVERRPRNPEIQASQHLEHVFLAGPGVCHICGHALCSGMDGSIDPYRAASWTDSVLGRQKSKTGREKNLRKGPGQQIKLIQGVNGLF